jgi:hypothetical protein
MNFGDGLAKRSVNIKVDIKELLLQKDLCKGVEILIAFV